MKKTFFSVIACVVLALGCAEYEPQKYDPFGGLSGGDPANLSGSWENTSVVLWGRMAAVSFDGINYVIAYDSAGIYQEKGTYGISGNQIIFHPETGGERICYWKWEPQGGGQDGKNPFIWVQVEPDVNQRYFLVKVQ